MRDVTSMRGHGCHNTAHKNTSNTASRRRTMDVDDEPSTAQFNMSDSEEGSGDESGSGDRDSDVDSADGEEETRFVNLQPYKATSETEWRRCFRMASLVSLENFVLSFLSQLTDSLSDKKIGSSSKPEQRRIVLELADRRRSDGDEESVDPSYASLSI